MDVTPFTIEVPDAVLDDLHRRLEPPLARRDPRLRLGLRQQPGVRAGVDGVLAYAL